jgi:lipopolysaccharide/colanic/teichoic acid biosynthesis glycosyltransferase
MAGTFYTQVGKRWFDAGMSAASLILLSPLLALIACAVRLTSSGPAIFSQTRLGLRERPFTIFKFRTMFVSQPSPGTSLLTAANDPRVTPLGHFLRATKLDELPQLVNVFLGHMSLVGPRPEVPRHTVGYTATQRRVFLARPGVTGPSIILNEEQLMANQADKEQYYLNSILPAKLKVDLDYCSQITFASDLRFLLITLGRLSVRHTAGSTSHDSINHLAAVSQISRDV